jgi:hypothetical protein
LLLCKDMRQGIFVLLIERATYPEKPNQIQFPKKNLQFLKPKNPISYAKSQLSNCPKAVSNIRKTKKPLIKPSKGFRHKNPVFSPGFLFYYNIPLVVGSASCMGSFLTAMRMAFAKALKMASILWCSLSPLQKTLRLHLAASEYDLKK